METLKTSAFSSIIVDLSFSGKLEKSALIFRKNANLKCHV